jgi:hypothetical protein
MNINHLNHLFFATALGSIVFLAMGCSDKKTMTYVSPTAGKTTPEPSAVPAGPASDAAAPLALASDHPGVVADGWIAIKDDPYEQRTHFSSGLQALETGMDRQIASMKMKNGSVSYRLQDANMTEVTAARTNLQTASDKVDETTADTWMSDKNLVAQAWMRMQAAFTKAQSS